MRVIASVFSALAMALSFPIGVLGQAAQTPPSVSVPRLVNVTGVYQPADGQPPPPGTVVTLLIYADAQGGTPLWQETQNVEFDKSGHFTLLLGASQADGIPVAVFASGEAQWLALHFAGLGEVEGPRARITSVPYALRSADADTLGGHPASAYVLTPTSTAATGHSASGATSTAKDTAQSSVTTDVILPGTANYLAKYVNAADVGPSALYDTGNGVGIGTTAPADVLHLRLTNTNGALTGLAVQNLGNTPTSYSGMLFYDQNGALAQFQGFNNSTHEYRINNIAPGGSINFMLGFASKFRVLSTGDVSIAGALLSNGVPFLYNLNTLSTFGGLSSGNVAMTGDANTGFGASSLSLNTTGGSNSGFGTLALAHNTTGDFNTASGANALSSNTTGAGNVAIGYRTLEDNLDGGGNVAVGPTALDFNTAGMLNSAVGFAALHNNTTGVRNTALGANAGLNATGDFNIYLGAGVDGVAGESNTMYLGNVGGQTKTIIAGVRGITTGAADAIAVVIDSNGQLGTINSSRRYKDDIRDMGDASSGLMKLRPVTYRYKQAYADGTKPIDYGLIAEEVEQVYPDLVAHLADGEVETVQYQKINAMLLNEVQKQHALVQQQGGELAQQRAQIAALMARLDALERERR